MSPPNLNYSHFRGQYIGPYTASHLGHVSGDPNLLVLCYLYFFFCIGWSCHSETGDSFPLVSRSLHFKTCGTTVHVSKFSITRLVNSFLMILLCSVLPTSTHSRSPRCDCSVECSISTDTSVSSFTDGSTRPPNNPFFYDDGVVVTSERQNGSRATARDAGNLASFEDNRPDTGTVQVTSILTYSHVCSRMLTYAHVCSRMTTHGTGLEEKGAAGATFKVTGPSHIY